MTALPTAIDHAARYRQHLAACGYQAKPATEWDARAAQSSWRRRHDDYTEAFLARLDLRNVASVLDVGCGPGLLTLPIARQVAEVHALDYSAGMLAGLRAAASAEGVHNVHSWQRSWEEDWDDIPNCDVAIASRSLMVPDLAAALAKLDGHARQRACITFSTGPRSGVPELAALLGRHWTPMPDHRYPINLLLDMGREPHVDYLPVSVRDSSQDVDDLLRQAAGLFDALDARDEGRIRDWHAASPSHRLGLAPTRRWAFISWQTGD
ncbi:class I SAM-dependent methyltransferase [Stenotrophomonas sp. SY1]|uniref:class I SAM-dependent methyltransferase n=1 Tax=Stenotrophomonas sp. SY1 TaxID=477235 RepID=UPI001E3AED76|nr:class I SAM-dependent methyltransferase [Stenotrophomonas sp. SY1]MCD9087273.1 class I SAM-dependent methyltransferase [Stenotrophomonas sp. SY1]